MYYFPFSKALLKPWAQNAGTQIGPIGTAINEPAADIAKVQADMQQIVTDITNWQVAQQEMQRLAAIMDATVKKLGMETREYIKRLKTNPLLTDAHQQSLQIISTSAVADLTDYKPVLTGKETGGNIHLSFQKHGADGMNIYARLHGEADVKLLGYAKQTPFVFMPPAAATGTVQIYEFCCMPMLANTEVGHRSDLISVRFTA